MGEGTGGGEVPYSPSPYPSPAEEEGNEWEGVIHERSQSR
jgi:hypothetical protein